MHVSRLRKALIEAGGDAERLVTRAGGYVLELGTGARDVDRWEASLGRARGARAAGRLEAARMAIEEALPVFRELDAVTDPSAPFSGLKAHPSSLLSDRPQWAVTRQQEEAMRHTARTGIIAGAVSIAATAAFARVNPGPDQRVSVNPSTATRVRAVAPPILRAAGASELAAINRAEVQREATRSHSPPAVSRRAVAGNHSAATRRHPKRRRRQ